MVWTNGEVVCGLLDPRPAWRRRDYFSSKIVGVLSFPTVTYRFAHGPGVFQSCNSLGQGDNQTWPEYLDVLCMSLGKWRLTKLSLVLIPAKR
jgi:hypothetical protein